MTRVLILVVSILLCCGSLSATKAEKRARQVLNEVWNEVCRRHFSDNFRTEHRKLFKKFEPAILKCSNDKELTIEINKFLHALGQSHIMLMAPVDSNFSRIMSVIRENANLDKEGGSFPDSPADTGIDVSQTEKRICVLRVRRNSPAAKAGIKMGDIILAVNKLELKPGKKFYIGWPLIVRALLSGRPGTKVTITVLDAKNIKRKVILTRQLNGEKWFSFGMLPRSYSNFYATVFPGNIAYVKFAAFTTPMVQHFRRVITGKLRNAKALIIDMRGNIGGLLMYPPWIAAWCCSQTVPFGKLIINGTELQPKSFPQAECFKGPTAVLIDNYSYSCAEIFAAGMQDSKVSRLFGTTTSGQCLPSIFLKLPSGFRLQTVTGSIIRVNGKTIEGSGVEPNEKVILSISSLRQGKDNVIEAARTYLQAKIN